MRRNSPILPFPSRTRKRLIGGYGRVAGRNYWEIALTGFLGRASVANPRGCTRFDLCNLMVAKI